MNTEDQSTAACRAHPTPPDSTSVDTAELNKLAAVFIACVQREQVSAGKVAWQQIIAHIESLVTAAAADVRKDAERYRYMRNNATFQSRNGPGLYWYLPRWNRGLPEGERLDRAIDAAIDAEMSTHSPATSSKEGE